MALVYVPFTLTVRKRPVCVKRVKNTLLQGDCSFQPLSLQLPHTVHQLTRLSRYHDKEICAIASLIRSIHMMTGPVTHEGRLWYPPGCPPGRALVQWCPEAVSSGHVKEC